MQATSVGVRSETRPSIAHKKFHFKDIAQSLSVTHTLYSDCRVTVYSDLRVTVYSDCRVTVYSDCRVTVYFDCRVTSCLF